jgi:general secretion pathway protein A
LVLLFDEAQALDTLTLEQLRLFANDIVNAVALVQIIFIGQPELLDRLKQPALRSLDQRIATRAELLPLRASEVHEYIEHRLHTCGGSVNKLFTRRALRTLVRNRLRIPREINLVCNGALILAYGAGSRRVTAAMIHGALRHYRGTQRSTAGVLRRCCKYIRATCQQTAIGVFCAGAVLSSLFLLPRPAADLHEQQAGSHPIKEVALAPSMNVSKNTPASNNPLAISKLPEPPMAIADRAPSVSPVNEHKPKTAPSIVVEDGDTLSSLAVANLGSNGHAAVQRLLKANPALTNPDLIYPGEIVFLPSKSE